MTIKSPHPLPISSEMLDYYLSEITLHWFNDHELPPDEVTDYAPCVARMRRQLGRRQDEKWFRLGLEYLLTAPDIDYEVYNSGQYPFDAADVYTFLAYTYHTLWPEATLPATPPDVTITSQQLEEWWQEIAQTDAG